MAGLDPCCFVTLTQRPDVPSYTLSPLPGEECADRLHGTVAGSVVPEPHSWLPIRPLVSRGPLMFYSSLSWLPTALRWAHGAQMSLSKLAVGASALRCHWDTEP